MVYSIYTDDRNTRQFEMSENDDLLVIYSLEGSKSPESISIYGVFKK